MVGDGKTRGARERECERKLLRGGGVVREKGHGRIREKLKERQQERGTVHGLIRGAINNLGPDI